MCRFGIGIPVTELYVGNMDPVEGGEDVVPDGFGEMELRFVIAVSDSETWTEIVLAPMQCRLTHTCLQWPGYPTQWFTISTFAINGRPFTRFDLARQITMTYAAFFAVRFFTPPCL